jgi:hypothetical protein
LACGSPNLLLDVVLLMVCASGCIAQMQVAVNRNVTTQFRGQFWINTLNIWQKVTIKWG